MPRGKEYVLLEDMQAMIAQSIAQISGQITAQLSGQITAQIAAQISADNAAQTALITGKVDSLKSVLETRLTTIEADIARAKKTCESNLEMAIKEINEMEEKRANIVVFGLPEPGHQAGSSPWEQDSKKVDQILEKITGRKIKFSIKFRIGAKAENKVRPIAVKLENPHEREEILGGASALKSESDWKLVYVKQDLTKNQRDLLKKQEEELKEEAQEKNSLLKNGEDWKWVIRGRGFQRHLIKRREEV